MYQVMGTVKLINKTKTTLALKNHCWQLPISCSIIIYPTYNIGQFSVCVSTVVCMYAASYTGLLIYAKKFCFVEFFSIFLKKINSGMGI